MSNEPLLDRIGTCRVCRTRRYTVRELNVSKDQVFTCYYCLDKQREENERAVE